MKFINNDEKTGKIYITIFTICLFVALFFAISLINMITKNVFNSTLLTIYKIELAITTGLVLALIWNEQYKKIILILIACFMVSLPATEILYTSYKNKEPLIYLHNKYDFKYKEMEIINKNDALFSSKRVYTVKYKDEKIKLVYTKEDGWNDNYKLNDDEETIIDKANKVKDKVKDKVKSFLE